MARHKSNRALPSPALPTSTSTFREVERFWKGRRTPPSLAYALDTSAIAWEEGSTSESELREGAWRNVETGEEVECLRVRLEVDEEGGWKGKGREGEEQWGVIVPSVPGLVILPDFLPPELQRALTRETLLHSKLPNLTSLSAHYGLPSDGLWNAWTEGRGEERVVRVDAGREVEVEQRKRVDFEPVTQENWEDVKGRGDDKGKAVEGEKEREVVLVKEVESTVAKLLPRLRWTTVGWSYDWTSKAYNFERPYVPLPPLIEKCSAAAVRTVPWKHVFPTVIDLGKNPSLAPDPMDKKDWRTWATDYRPEAGIINFYQLTDSLSPHQDQSEIDAERPLVSFSIGHSALFLVGGQSREITPVSILLRSGDGILMSGEGRRAFHSLARVLEGTLPAHLASDQSEEEAGPGWCVFGEYLERGTRINFNIREVF